MVTEVHVDGYDALNELLHSLNPETKLVLYFAGQVNDKGENWCPDCQAAEPIVKEVLEECSKKNFTFIHVSVGSREEWKDPNCKFRTDERFKLTSVPTLIKFHSVERLNDIECQDKENIRMLFEDL
ncbi:conserved hypothetical protein [Pediculus humanus corporis]|uniref:Thioredoxin domain-containing protein 17 n=1 Tax=Pediculus humanus subsp. corporis TaxID=121224 RepID=E0VCW0_PEDHC|nr:uncharacterized protein Phum_PHUM098430 [Pediculus humanus corporis]EEB11216.1 conserved hypothetical protein [Pediculus humanus corporis]